MKCPVCVREGTKSRVDADGGSATTAMASPSWWDEDGVYHHHELNWSGSSYQCSLGHRWHTSYRPACPAGDYPAEHLETERPTLVKVPATHYRLTDHGLEEVAGWAWQEPK
jgi:hypothetical protein